MNKISYIIHTCNYLVGEQAYMAPLQQKYSKIINPVLWHHFGTKNVTLCLSVSAVKKLNTKNWHHFGTLQAPRGRGRGVLS